MENMKRENALIMDLAWPCILENLSATLVSLVDTAMVGSLGALATAAVSTCASPSWLINGIVQAIGVGGTALVARSIGAGDRNDAEHTAEQVFRVALVFSAFIMGLVLLIAPLVPVIMRAKAEVHEEATAYMRIVASCYIFHYTGMTMSALLRGAGDTKTPMIAGLMANVINTVGNFLLIYSPRDITVFGLTFPMWGAGWGVRGAAIASAIGMGIAGLYLCLHMYSKNSVLKAQLNFKAPMDFSVLQRVVRIGTPAALERVVINLGQMIFAGMINAVGTAESAAYMIAINVEGLGYMPAYGFSAAATSLVGQRLGAGEPDEAARLGKRCIYMSLLLLSVIGVLMWLGSGWLARLFSPDADVVRVASVFIAICAVEQPFNAFSIVASGALRGAGDTMRPFLYGLVTMWSIRILGAVILSDVLHLGVYSILWAMVADLAVRGALLHLRFLNGKWKTAKV